MTLVKTGLIPTNPVQGQGQISATCFDILGHRVAIGSRVTEGTVWMRRLFRSFPPCPAPAAWPDLHFTISLETAQDGQPRWWLWRGETPVGQATDLWQLCRLLEWQLDLFLEQAAGRYGLLHAGAVATPAGEGLLLPGDSGAGKSSLTLALLLAGYGYLSDEIAAIEPQTALLYPFPKAVSLKNRAVFPELASQDELWFGPPDDGPTAGEPDSKSVWYLHPDDVRPNAVVRTPRPVRWLIFPRYAPGASPTLTPLSSAQAMHRLLEHAINRPWHGRGGLGLLGRLAREARAFSLVTGDDLPAAVSLIEAVVQD